jgi:hypothetical protein
MTLYMLFTGLGVLIYADVAHAREAVPGFSSAHVAIGLQFALLASLSAVLAPVIHFYANRFPREHSSSVDRASARRGRPGPEQGLAPVVAKLQLNADGSLVHLEAGDWFVCFVPGIEEQWWHPLVHARHKHVFAMRPAGDGKWTLFEPWWTRLLAATITEDQASQFLRWGALGDVLLVREAIPGWGGQVRGWMNCAALACYLLGRPYWVWTPHGLYRRLLREPHVCRVDSSDLLRRDLSTLGMESAHVADVVAGAERCGADEARWCEGALKPLVSHRSRGFTDPFRTTKEPSCHHLERDGGSEHPRSYARSALCVNREVVETEMASSATSVGQ